MRIGKKQEESNMNMRRRRSDWEWVDALDWKLRLVVIALFVLSAISAIWAIKHLCMGMWRWISG